MPATENDQADDEPDRRQQERPEVPDDEDSRVLRSNRPRISDPS